MVTTILYKLKTIFKRNIPEIDQQYQPVESYLLAIHKNIQFLVTLLLIVLKIAIKWLSYLQ